MNSFWFRFTNFPICCVYFKIVFDSALFQSKMTMLSEPKIRKIFLTVDVDAGRKEKAMHLVIRIYFSIKKTVLFLSITKMPVHLLLIDFLKKY